jgi:uncharacterized RDD family membrane protein YckC
LLRILEVNPLLIGALPASIAILSSKRRQRIGDMLAGTVVVSTQVEWRNKTLGDLAASTGRRSVAPPVRSPRRSM